MSVWNVAHDPNPLPEAAIDALLADDLPAGDLTTRALGIGAQPGRMVFKARHDLVVCGTHEAARLLSRVGARIATVCVDGLHAQKGTLLLEAEGPAASLLAGWKLAQTLMEWASGVATATQAIVNAARSASPRIAVLCTRKSAPFTRQLSLKAIRAGGAEIHRLGLSDSVMLFPEHRAFFEAGDNFKVACARLKTHAPERMVMVEVTCAEDALAAAEAMADVIQLEKLDVETISHIVRSIRKRADGRPLVAVAGGVSAQNAALFAQTGADALVTSAPFYSKPAEIHVDIEPQ